MSEATYLLCFLHGAHVESVVHLWRINNITLSRKAKQIHWVTSIGLFLLENPCFYFLLVYWNKNIHLLKQTFHFKCGGGRKKACCSPFAFAAENYFYLQKLELIFLFLCLLASLVFFKKNICQDYNIAIPFSPSLGLLRFQLGVNNSLVCSHFIGLSRLQGNPYATNFFHSEDSSG